MNTKINANAALSFLLRNEYQRFFNAFVALQNQQLEEKKITEDEVQKAPTFEEWLVINKIAQKESSIVGLDGKKLPGQ